MKKYQQFPDLTSKIITRSLCLLSFWALISQKTIAQSLTVSGGTTVNITTNTYYDNITVQNNGTLNVIAPAVLTVGATGTATTTIVVDFQNGCSFTLNTGATLIVNGRLNNSNNSENVVINGTVTVNGNVTGGSGSVMVGSGTINSTGSITGAGIFFGNSNDCNSGPCNGNNLCSFSTSNTITASGTISHCNGTNTTPVINGTSITSATYQWRSSTSLTGTFSNVTGGSGATSQNYTPPTNISATIYYRRDATVSGCTQSSNIITVTVGGTPSITIQPSSSQTVCVGNAANFSVTAIGTGLTYQWRKGTTAISGATNSTYTIASVATGDAATNYNCVVTSTCTAPNTATTNDAALVVTNTSLPTATASTTASYCVGGTLSLTGTRSGGTGTLVSAWTGPNGYASSNVLSPTVSSSATAAMAGTYTHTVTDANGCRASASTSNSSIANFTLSNISSTNLIARYNFTGNANDASGSGNNGTLQGSPTLTSNRITQTNSAYSFNGTNQFVSTTTSFTNPNTFTYSVWFNTTTNTGGKLIGFGNSQTGLSTSYDRHLYMTNAGTLIFGIWTGTAQTISSSSSYNDGNWHMATASLSASGMRLYVDGSLVANNASVTSGSSYTGFWKIGYDNLSGWPSSPSSNYFQGTLDDILIYSRLLSDSEVLTLYNNPDGVSSPPVCQGGTLSLTANSIAGATYSWTGPNSFSSATQNPTVTAMNTSKSGIYTVTASLAGCPSTTSASTLGSINSALNPNLSQVPTSGLITRFDFTNNTLDGSGNGNNATAQSSPTLTTDRANQSNRAYQFNGTSQFMSTNTLFTNPSNFTLSIWFRTTTTSGGKLIGFGSSQTGSSGSYDRHIYMTNSGTIIFGVFPSTAQTISSTTSYNDGNWHQAVASLSSTNGIKLYIDGTLVSSNPAVISAQNFSGYWRVAYDNLSGWTSVPTSNYFSGSLDEVLIYNRELSASEVTTIYSSASGVSSPAVCNGGTLNITASSLAGATYSWTGPNSFTSSSQNPSISNFSSANTGVYTLTVTGSNGCISDPIYTNATINSALNPDMSNIPTSGLQLNYVFSGNANDFSGNSNNGTLQNSPSQTTDRFLTTNAAYTFNGTNQHVTTTTQLATPTNFSISVWFRTTTTSGGKLVGFGSNQTGSSVSYDKHIYMSNAGNILFGVFPGSVQTISSPTALNDGNWHQAIASLSSTNGMRLYIDGVLAASNSSITSSQSYTGYWRIAYDNLSGWTSTPSSAYFNGSLDDIAIYNTELSSAEVTSLYNNSATGSNSPICNSSTLFLTAKTISGATYTWSGPNSFSSTTQNPSITSASSANAGTYNVVARITSTGCTSDAVPVAVVVSATTLSNNTISSAQTICASTTPSSLTGTVPTGGSGGYTYQWLVSTTSASTGFSNIPSATSQNYAPSSLSTTTWYRRDAINSGCRNTSSTLEVTVLSNGTWRGATSTDWNTSSNWCGGIPSATTDVIIPSGTTFEANITTPNATVRNITVNNGATLNLNANIPFNIYGNFVNNGTYVDGGSTVSFLGSTNQGITNMNTVKNMTVNNAAGVTLNSNLTVTGALTLTSGTLTSSGRLSVNLSTGYIDRSGAGSVSGNMTVIRNSSDFVNGDEDNHYHYIGTPLDGATLAELNDDSPLDATKKLYGYYEGDGNTLIQKRWKSLVTGTYAKPLSTVMNSQLFPNSATSMVGYCLWFGGGLMTDTPPTIDITGTYNHSSSASYSTGNLTYTNGGQAYANGWHLVANPFPSYIDWRSASITKTNLENGITYYNAATNQNADYIPAVGMFPEASNNGGSPFIPAMQAFWVQVSPSGSGSITVANDARVGVPNLSGYPSAPSFYRVGRASAQSFKLTASNQKGSDQTCIRFGRTATSKFDNGLDMYNTGSNSDIPTIVSVSENVKYNINSLPEIDENTTVDIQVVTPITGVYKIAISELGNMEDYPVVNLYDKKTNTSQNLKINGEYTYTAIKGESADRFQINFKNSLITNNLENQAVLQVAIAPEADAKIALYVSNAQKNQAEVIVTNLLGQEIYSNSNQDISSGKALLNLPNVQASTYLVKAIIDGKTFVKQVFISK